MHFNYQYNYLTNTWYNQGSKLYTSEKHRFCFSTCSFTINPSNGDQKIPCFPLFLNACWSAVEGGSKSVDCRNKSNALPFPPHLITCMILERSYCGDKEIDSISECQVLSKWKRNGEFCGCGGFLGALSYCVWPHFVQMLFLLQQIEFVSFQDHGKAVCYGIVRVSVLFITLAPSHP